MTDALSAFSRLVDPNHRHVFDRIFETLESGLSKLGDTSGARTKAISGLLHLIKDIPMDGRQGYDVLGYICGEFIGADKTLESGPYPVYGGNGLRGYATSYNHGG